MCVVRRDSASKNPVLVVQNPAQVYPVYICHFNDTDAGGYAVM